MASELAPYPLAFNAIRHLIPAARFPGKATLPMPFCQAPAGLLRNSEVFVCREKQGGRYVHDYRARSLSPSRTSTRSASALALISSSSRRLGASKAKPE